MLWGEEPHDSGKNRQIVGGEWGYDPKYGYNMKHGHKAVYTHVDFFLFSLQAKWKKI